MVWVDISVVLFDEMNENDEHESERVCGSSLEMTGQMTNNNNNYWTSQITSTSHQNPPLRTMLCNILTCNKCYYPSTRLGQVLAWNNIDQRYNTTQHNRTHLAARLVWAFCLFQLQPDNVELGYNQMKDAKSETLYLQKYEDSLLQIECGNKYWEPGYGFWMTNSWRIRQTAQSELSNKN